MRAHPAYLENDVAYNEAKSALGYFDEIIYEFK